MKFHKYLARDLDLERGSTDIDCWILARSRSKDVICSLSPFNIWHYKTLRGSADFDC